MGSTYQSVGSRANEPSCRRIVRCSQGDKRDYRQRPVRRRKVRSSVASCSMARGAQPGSLFRRRNGRPARELRVGRQPMHREAPHRWCPTTWCSRNRVISRHIIGDPWLPKLSPGWIVCDEPQARIILVVQVFGCPRRPSTSQRAQRRAQKIVALGQKNDIQSEIFRSFCRHEGVRGAA